MRDDLATRKTRIRGVRYGGATTGGHVSDQQFTNGSSNVLKEAVTDAGHYSSSTTETYREPVYYSTKAGIVQHYKEVYGDKLGKGGWKDTLAKEYAAATGKNVASVKKSLNPERINQPGTRQDWKTFGKTLPPSAFIEKTRPRKPKRAKVTFSIYFKISNNYKRVNKTVYLSDNETMRLMENEDFDAVLEAYHMNNIDQMEELDIGEMTVELED